MRKNSFFRISIIFILNLSICLFSGKTLLSNYNDNLYEKGEVKLIKAPMLNKNSIPKTALLELPISLVRDNQGHIYVSDFRANNIKKFDAKGNFLKIIGREGQGPGDLNGPSLMVFARDRLIIWELRNRRFSFFDAEGKFIKFIRVYPGEGYPRKLRALANGDVVMEREKSYFFEVEKPQNCTIEIYSPHLEHKKTIYSQEVWRNKFIIEPIRTNVPQPFQPDVFWEVSPRGKIAIAFSKKYEIEIYDPHIGKLFSFSGSLVPAKVTQRDKEEFFNSQVFGTIGGQSTSIRRGAPDYIKKHTHFPKTKPYFNSIFIDSKENILVHINKETTDNKYENYDVFDSEGNYINTIRFIDNIHSNEIIFLDFAEDCFWVRVADDNGLFEIIKYKIAR